MPRPLRPDLWLAVVAALLLATGVVMVYSASAIVAAERQQDPFFFAKKQLLWAFIGIGALLAALRVDYRRLEPLGGPLLLAVAALLVAVLVVAPAVHGTRRWIRMGPLSFQPAEAAKLVLVLYLARVLARRGSSPTLAAPDLVRPLVAGGGLAALVLAQPDLGNSLTLLAVTFALLFLAGARTRHLLLVLAAAVPFLVAAVWLAPYRVRRVWAFLDPWADPRGSGYQIIQSWLALGAGGLWGRGIGESRQKLFYLPEAHTDFIFAVVGEELGFLGSALLIAAFAVLVWRGLRIGLRAPDEFGAYLALGLTLLLATQTLVHLGVVTGLLPTKGLPLPFVSFGGSALVGALLATGLLLNVSQHTHV